LHAVVNNNWRKINYVNKPKTQYVVLFALFLLILLYKYMTKRRNTSL
jgi:hypothetical protein